jgi:hypothetical protein
MKERRIKSIYILVLLLAACAGQIKETLTPPTLTLLSDDQGSLKTAMMPSETVAPTSAETAIISLTPSPTPIGPQILANSGFDSGVGSWDRPYGALTHTKADFHNGPGAGRLTTSDSSGFMDYLGNIGQCIDLTDYVEQWPAIDGAKHMRLEAYLLPGEEISRVTLNGIFIDDKSCGTGHVGSFDIPAVEEADDWILLSGETILPESAQSLHVFISASGATDQASVLIDDVRAYSIDPYRNQDR